MCSNQEMKKSLITNFKDFKFATCKLLDLPIESNRDNYVRRKIPSVLFSHVNPTPISKPVLVSYSADALVDLLDLDPVVTKQQEFLDFMAGNLLETSTPLAHRYGGHQFGVWASQLGDGRAILLGEYLNSKGERWELQLKGAGLTPYSRDGDGRAVLRSSIREFLCSEALHYLGIPTTRAGAIVVFPHHKIIRDLLYDGHPILEPASIVLRIAPTWFRIGSFELLMRNGEEDILERLLDFVIKEHFPEISDDDDKVFNFLRKVFRLNSDLVVAWQAIGFTHGVMNTDNISIAGVTIDYGPYGFMEAYDPLYVPNHSDSQARYCYGNQIKIMLYNLLMLIQALTPLIRRDQIEEVARLMKKESQYIEEKLQETFSKKLGLTENSTKLVEILINIFEETKADFVMTFRNISETPFEKLKSPSKNLWGLSIFAKHEKYPEFLKIYDECLKSEGRTDEDRMVEMCNINPRYTLRNWIAQEVIKSAEEGNYSEVDNLLNILKKPFTRQQEAEDKGYASPPPSWAKNICVSCSS
ncbi:hypothetical protein O3M35_010606 [Rhynocoris fuscipes]|uniref:Selenoprotein O n=1 Tax=Rhynocoris fuscipes TaxID=488301 RepID=A0AAW1D2Q5_9HEMI